MQKFCLRTVLYESRSSTYSLESSVSESGYHNLLTLWPISRIPMVILKFKTAKTGRILGVMTGRQRNILFCHFQILEKNNGKIQHLFAWKRLFCYFSIKTNAILSLGVFFIYIETLIPTVNVTRRIINLNQNYLNSTGKKFVITEP